MIKNIFYDCIESRFGELRKRVKNGQPGNQAGELASMDQDNHQEMEKTKSEPRANMATVNENLSFKGAVQAQVKGAPVASASPIPPRTPQQTTPAKLHTARGTMATVLETINITVSPAFSTKWLSSARNAVATMMRFCGHDDSTPTATISAPPSPSIGHQQNPVVAASTGSVRIVFPAEEEAVLGGCHCEEPLGLMSDELDTSLEDMLAADPVLADAIQADVDSFSVNIADEYDWQHVDVDAELELLMAGSYGRGDANLEMSQLHGIDEPLERFDIDVEDVWLRIAAEADWLSVNYSTSELTIAELGWPCHHDSPDTYDTLAAEAVLISERLAAGVLDVATPREAVVPAFGTLASVTASLCASGLHGPLDSSLTASTTCEVLDSVVSSMSTSMSSFCFDDEQCWNKIVEEADRFSMAYDWHSVHISGGGRAPPRLGSGEVKVAAVSRPAGAVSRPAGAVSSPAASTPQCKMVTRASRTDPWVATASAKAAPIKTSCPVATWRTAHSRTLPRTASQEGVKPTGLTVATERFASATKGLKPASNISASVSRYGSHGGNSTASAAPAPCTPVHRRPQVQGETGSSKQVSSAALNPVLPTARYSRARSAALHSCSFNPSQSTAQHGKRPAVVSPQPSRSASATVKRPVRSTSLLPPAVPLVKVDVVSSGGHDCEKTLGLMSDELDVSLEDMLAADPVLADAVQADVDSFSSHMTDEYGWQHVDVDAEMDLLMGRACRVEASRIDDIDDMLAAEAVQISQQFVAGTLVARAHGGSEQVLALVGRL